MTASRPLPLAGIRVVDFTQIFLGPSATQTLGDFGADVIKIERPSSGDVFRWAIDDPDGFDHPAFCSLNRNKRSIAVDLRDDAGREIAAELVRQSDVVVSNYRPGVMERLGLGYAALRQLQPRLVYAYGSAFGSDGPHVGRGGMDIIAQAYSGAMSRKADPAHPYAIYPISLADFSCGMLLVQGILLALLARDRTGEGQKVEVNLYDAMLSMQMLEAAVELRGERAELNWAQLPLVGTYETSDGAIVIVGAFKSNPLRDICVALGLEDLSARPELSTMAGQAANKAFLRETFRERLATGSTAHWLELLEAEDVLCAPVRTLSEALADPQTAHNEMLLEMEHGTIGRIRLVGQPVHLSATRARLARAAPTLGEHTDAILGDLGYDAERVAQLRSQGVVT